MKIYGLFNYVYDYYEWEDLVVSSRKVEKLIEYATQRSIHVVNSDQEHVECANDEIAHAMIKELELI